MASAAEVVRRLEAMTGREPRWEPDFDEPPAADRAPGPAEGLHSSLVTPSDVAEALEKAERDS